MEFLKPLWGPATLRAQLGLKPHWPSHCLSHQLCIKSNWQKRSQQSFPFGIFSEFVWNHCKFAVREPFKNTVSNDTAENNKSATKTVTTFCLQLALVWETTALIESATKSSSGGLGDLRMPSFAPCQITFLCFCCSSKIRVCKRHFKKHARPLSIQFFYVKLLRLQSHPMSWENLQHLQSTVAVQNEICRVQLTLCSCVWWCPKLCWKNAAKNTLSVCWKTKHALLCFRQIRIHCSVLFCKSHCFWIILQEIIVRLQCQIFMHLQVLGHCLSEHPGLLHFPDWIHRIGNQRKRLHSAILNWCHQAVSFVCTEMVQERNFSVVTSSQTHLAWRMVSLPTPKVLWQSSSLTECEFLDNNVMWLALRFQKSLNDVVVRRIPKWRVVLKNPQWRQSAFFLHKVSIARNNAVCCRFCFCCVIFHQQFLDVNIENHGKFECSNPSTKIFCRKGSWHGELQRCSLHSHWNSLNLLWMEFLILCETLQLWKPSWVWNLTDRWTVWVLHSQSNLMNRKPQCGCAFLHFQWMCFAWLQSCSDSAAQRQFSVASFWWPSVNSTAISDQWFLQTFFIAKLAGQGTWTFLCPFSVTCFFKMTWLKMQQTTTEKTQHSASGSSCLRDN